MNSVAGPAGANYREVVCNPSLSANYGKGVNDPSSIAVCYTVTDMSFENFEFYVPTVLEDIRRLGIIVTSAGFLSGVLEGGNTWLAIWLALVGIFLLALGNMRKKR